MQWEGRIDGVESDVLRLHQVIKEMTLEQLMLEENNGKKVCFVSFASDEGVRRNLGRLGAREGWIHLKKMMASFPVFYNDITFYDLSEIIEVNDRDLEKGQKKLGEVVEKLKDKGYFVTVLGGGHEVAYGTHLGVLNHALKNEEKPKIGIVNFDAHFDMRSYETGATSGTMFLQIADDYRAKNLDFNYNVFGIQKFSNTQRLFDVAKENNVKYVRASELDASSIDHLYNIASENDYIHLTICTDVFQITSAPGVSAPQPLGISPILSSKLLKVICKYAKNLTIDIGEINPEYDADDRTSRLMASLIYTMVLAHLEKE